jgi:uncharacterized membrane protein YraQ (UPF0718 family)
VALLFLPKVSESGSGDSLAIIFVSIVLEAIPFMLLGSIVGGVIEAFVSRERLATLLPRKGWLIVLVAAGAGIFFPVCECAVVPVVRRLVGKGLPTSAAIAYLLGGPIVNPIVAASTALAYAFDWRIVILRLAFGYGIAVVIGFIMGRAFIGTSAIRDDFAVVGGNEPALSCCDRPPSSGRNDEGIAEAGGSLSPIEPSVSSACGCGQALSSGLDGWVDKMGSAFNHAMEDFLAVGHYLVIGAFVAAVAQTYIDRSSFLGLSAIPILSIVLMMVLAILLNLCSEADAFIAASFQGLVSVPAQLAFLLTGPMFDLKLLLMYQSLFRRRPIVVLTLSILAMILMAAAVLELFNGVV